MGNQPVLRSCTQLCMILIYHRNQSWLDIITNFKTQSWRNFSTLNLEPTITNIIYAVIASHYWGPVSYSIENNSSFQDRKSPNIVLPLVMKPIFFHSH